MTEQLALTEEEARKAHAKVRREVRKANATTGLAPRVQERKRYCADEAEAEDFIAKLPRKAREVGIIERAEGADGSVLVVATWETGDYDPRLYKYSPAIDGGLPDSMFFAGKPVHAAKLERGDAVNLSTAPTLPSAREGGAPLSKAYTVAEVDDISVTLIAPDGDRTFTLGLTGRGTTYVYRYARRAAHGAIHLHRHNAGRHSIAS